MIDQIELGEIYTDRLTDFTGIAIAKTEYLNGCLSILIQPQKLSEDGNIIEAHWLDIQRLVAIAK